MSLRTAFQPRLSTPSARIVRSYGFEGVTFQPPPEYGFDWLRRPFESKEHSGMVAFLAQIEEEDFAHLLDDHGLRLTWDSLYELAASEDHRDGLPLIGMPPIRAWRARRGWRIRSSPSCSQAGSPPMVSTFMATSAWPEP